jgi:hypothetical protein
MTVGIDDEQAVLHRTQNGLGFGHAADQLLSELPVTVEKFLEGKARPTRFGAATDKKGGGLFSMHDLFDQFLKFTPRSNPFSPNDQDEYDQDRRSRNCADQNPVDFEHLKLSLAETIAETAHGFDSIAGRSEFFPQPSHMRVDGAGVDNAFVAPDVVE